MGAHHSLPALSSDPPVPQTSNQQNESHIATLDINRVVEQDTSISSDPKGHGWCHLLSAFDALMTISSVPIRHDVNKSAPQPRVHDYQIEVITVRRPRYIYIILAFDS
jgi:hypothetical protein